MASGIQRRAAAQQPGVSNPEEYAEECSKLTNRMEVTAIPPGRRPSALAESQNGTRDQGFAVAAPAGAPLTAPCRSAGPMSATGGSDGMAAEELN